MNKKLQFNKLELSEEIHTNTCNFLQNLSARTGLNVYGLGEKICGSPESLRGSLQRRKGITVDNYVKISQFSGESIDKIIGRDKIVDRKRQVDMTIESPLKKRKIEGEDMQKAESILKDNMKYVPSNSSEDNKGLHPRSYVKSLTTRSSTKRTRGR